MLNKSLLLFVLTTLCSLQTGATTVLPVSLQRMSATAELIFLGRVTGNEVRLDEGSGQVATYTTFSVIDVLKGSTADTHTIKQIGGRLASARARMIIHGVPRFSVGGQYIVFLPQPSSLGFSSPIGLSQGRFTVQDHNGEILVSNGRPVAALLAAPAAPALPDTPQAASIRNTPILKSVENRPASARLADFLQAVHSLAGE